MRSPKLPFWGWLVVAYASIPYFVVLAIMFSAALSPPSSATRPDEVVKIEEAAEEPTRAATPEPVIPEDIPEAAAPSAIQAVEVHVTKVVDGDTIWVEMPDGSTEKVRFIGVDTPESTTETEPYGEEASAYTRAELMGKTVYLETDAELRDKYGRLLAHVWLEMPGELADAEVRDHLFNAHLLLAGYANLMTIPPNVKYVDHLRQYEGEARIAQRGLWTPSAPVAASPPVAAPPAATPAPTPPPPPAPAPPVAGAYIANSNTGKFHHSYCRWVDEMLPEHRVPYATRDQAVAAGYIPCKVCSP